MLDTYLTQTAQLLQNPAAPTSLYSTPNLTQWVNTARGQLAGEAQCVRFEASVPTVIGSNGRVIAFSAISLAGAIGVQGVFSINTIWYLVASGRSRLRRRSFPWFSLYELNNPVPQSGPPNVWAPYAEGINGSFYLSPLPDLVYTLKLDCICYPSALNADSDPEAIPYPWTDAVPYFAAYLALLSSQTSARNAEAMRMKDLYTEFVGRARRTSTPQVMPRNYPQQPNPTRANQLALHQPRAGGG